LRIIDSAYHRLAAVWVVVLFGNLVIVFFLAFAAAIPRSGPEIAALQLSFTEDRFRDTLADWEPGAIDAYREWMWLDYIFPLAYAIFLASAVALLTAQPGLPPTRIQRALFVMPFAAAPLDYLENTLHLILLRDPDHLAAGMIGLASIAAAIKWALIGVVFAASVAIFVWRVLAAETLRSRSE
jgi:hypothetical protein